MVPARISPSRWSGHGRLLALQDEATDGAHAKPSRSVSFSDAAGGGRSWLTSRSGLRIERRASIDVHIDGQTVESADPGGVSRSRKGSRLRADSENNPDGMRSRGQSMSVYQDATFGGGDTTIEAVQAEERRISINLREATDEGARTMRL